jgi:hypothetical protein
VIQLSEKSCSECGKKLPAHARFCESCGALVEEPPVKEDLRGRFYTRLWKIPFYPFVICFVASAVLYWLSHGLKYRGLIGWAWMDMMTPSNRSFWGSGIYSAISSKDLSHNKRVRTIFPDISWSVHCPTRLFGPGVPWAPALSFYRIWLLAR